MVIILEPLSIGQNCPGKSQTQGHSYCNMGIRKKIGCMALFIHIHTYVHAHIHTYIKYTHTETQTYL